MVGAMTRTARALALWVGVAVGLAGCAKIQSTFREILGYGPLSNPTVNLKSAETRWLLVKNPRFGDVPSEPEYIWVEEDKVPLTMKTLVLGKRAIIASPDIVAQYSSPPGGGKISPRQGGPYAAAARPKGASPTTPAAKASGGNGPSGAASRPGAGPLGAPAPLPAANRGYVVYVDTRRVVIDLAGRDGLQPGSVVSVRRDNKLPVVHPVTGEVLGEIDDEVATVRVTEIREKFSVAEVQSLENGSQIQVKDRVVLK